MTIEAIAQRAEVSAQSVYSIFKSKTGILIELLNQATFGADYEDAVRKALSASDPKLAYGSQPLLPGRSTTPKVQLSICCEVRVWLHPSWQNWSSSEKECAMRGSKE